MAVAEGLDIHHIAARELNGQILQGLGTADEVHAFLEARGRPDEFPLFTAVWKVLHGHAQARDVPDLLEPRHVGDGGTKL